jgi:hypothetical protein
MNETQVKNFQNGKTLALWLGGAVYVGVVLLFLAFYETLMTAQFTGLLKTVARVGAFLVTANAIALPVALHYWTVTKWHKIAAIIFYGGDILLMGFNVLAATMTDNPPAWVAVYAGYAPVSIVYVLFGWAVLYMADPAQRALIALSEAMTDAQVAIVKRTAEHVQSDEGTSSIIEPFAAKLAARIFNERSLTGTARALPIEGDEAISQIVNRVVSQMRENNIPILANDSSNSMSNSNGNSMPELEGVGQSVPFRSNGRGH